MDGLHKTAGVGPLIEIGGKSYLISPRILRHRALIQATIVKKRGNPFDMVREASSAFIDAPQVLQSLMPSIMAEAKNWNMVTIREVSEFLEDTWEGRALTVWLAIRDNDPEHQSLETVEQIFFDGYEETLRQKGWDGAEKWWSEITSAIDQAEGSDELGNSTGSQPTGEKEATNLSPGE